MGKKEEKISKADVVKYLEERCDSREAILNEARDFHFQHLADYQKQSFQFMIKIGELSLLVGAAIGPVMFLSGRQTSHPFFIFFAVAVYLLNGIWTIWKAKDTIEKQVDAFSPGMFHKMELDIYPMQFAANKLISDPDNREYVEEYLKCESVFLKNNTESEIPKRNIDFSLDIFASSFIIASLLFIRAVWPFGDRLYWLFFAVILACVFISIVRSYFQAQDRAEINEKNTRDLNKIKREFVEWRDGKIFDNKNTNKEEK